MTLEGSQTVAGYGAKRHTGFYPNLSSIDPACQGVARRAETERDRTKKSLSS